MQICKLIRIYFSADLLRVVLVCKIKNVGFLYFYGVLPIEKVDKRLGFRVLKRAVERFVVAKNAGVA